MLSEEHVLVDRRMKDGSRKFLELSQTTYPERLVQHLRLLPGAEVTEFLDSIPESWIDFSFETHKFSINNQFGEFWFFVADATCPDEVLFRIRDYFVKILV